MPKTILLLSGPIASGKSTLCRGLEERLDAATLSSRQLLAAAVGRSSRGELQAAGERIENETGGAWLADALTEAILDLGADVIIVDAVRTSASIGHIRRAHRSMVTHIHLTAPTPVLIRRYFERGHAQGREMPSYTMAREHPIESETDNLSHIADFTVDTGALDAAAVVARVMRYLGNVA